MTHSHHHHHASESTQSIKVAFFLNLGFTLLEIVGGIWTNSLAILSDSIHDLGDSLSLGLSWYLAKVSDRGNDHKYSYGYRRYSLLGALVNTLVLIFGSVIVLTRAIPRLLHPEPTQCQRHGALRHCRHPHQWRRCAALAWAKRA